MVKVGKSFSVESSLLNKFLEEVELSGSNPNSLFERILNDRYLNLKIVKCAVCGASYSSKFSLCPNCDKTRVSKEISAKEQAELDKIDAIQKNKDRVRREQDIKVLQAGIVRYVDLLGKGLNQNLKPITEEERQEYMKRIEDNKKKIGELMDPDKSLIHNHDDGKNGHKDNQEGNEEAKIDSEAEPNKP